MKPLLALAAVALIAALAGAAVGAEAATHKRQSCGTYASVSIYPKAKVTKVRGASCREALKVAKRFDHKGVAKGKWTCGYGHGGRRLFSCGYGGSGGNLAHYPHALVAKGVGQPDGMRAR